MIRLERTPLLIESARALERQKKTPGPPRQRPTPPLGMKREYCDRCGKLLVKGGSTIAPAATGTQGSGRGVRCPGCN